MNATLAKALEAHDLQRVEILKLAEVGADAEMIAAEINALEGMRPTVSSYVSPSNMCAWITGNFNDLDEVAEVRRILAKHGYRMISKNEHPESGYFTVDHRKEGVFGPITLSCHMPSEGSSDATCSYVQVGEKTVPVYELKCTA